MSAKTKPYEQQIKSATRYVESEQLVQQFPGCTVAVIKNDQLLWTQGFGYCDIENRIHAHPHTLMRIASISKSLTSAAIGILLQRNKLQLTDIIQKYIPDYPLLPYKIKKQGQERLSDELCSITIEQLASHQSGIRDYKPGSNEFYSNKHYKSSIDALEIFKNDPLEFKPGTNYAYSTYNYCILQSIIERIINDKFVNFMQEQVFDKLSMHNTYFELHNNILPNRSKQYLRKIDVNDEMIREQTEYPRGKWPRLYNAPYIDNSNKYAGGGYLSTCIDIAYFANQFVLGDFLSHDTKKLLFNGNGKYNYGIAWEVYKNKDGEIIEISHAGGAVGGCSHMLVLPKHKLVVVILINTDAANPYITRKIAKYFVGTKNRSNMSVSKL